MIAFICLFFPAVLGVGIYEHLKKQPLSRRQWFYRYCANTVFTNGICFAVKQYLLDTGSQTFAVLGGDTTPATAANFLIMAIPTAIILAFVQVLFSKCVDVTVEGKTEEEASIEKDN